MITRRRFLRTTAALPLAGCGPQPLIASIEQSVIWPGRQTGETWFHPRACRVPGDGLLMAIQTISGSDVFGPVHFAESVDGGRNWSDPQPIPGLRRRAHPDGVEEGVCDTVPTYHPPTNTVLFMGWNVYYQDDKLTRPNEQRWPVYMVRRGDGSWTEPRKLEWSNPEAARIYGSNCSQRLTLPSGDLLVPMTFAPYGREDRLVGTVRCSFDGRVLEVQEHGNALELAVKRGLLEPSLAFFDNRYFMTIRAEDGHGYLAVSGDGLEWQPQIPWRWDDGELLTMSTTQQHWLSHSDALFLVYTRKAEENADLFRWRTPLFVARFDHQRLVLVRDTERIVVPMSEDGARLGNFHIVDASPTESLVTVGETIPDRAWAGDTLQARIRWSKANLLVTTLAAVPPVPVIFDTDIMGDVDDVGAVTVLHALAARGEAKILAMGVSAKHPACVPCLSALNDYFGRSRIPIGVVKGDAFLRDTRYADVIAREFPHSIASADVVPDAAELYLRTLAAQPDSSVVMISVGQCTNFRNLLQLETGPDVVARKVKLWVAMAGKFPSGREANLIHDGPAAQYAIEHWPTPIVFSPWKIGRSIQTGGRLGQLPETSPVRRAYELFKKGIKPHNSFDQTAVLHAIRPDAGLWTLESTGHLFVDSDGANEWRTSPDGDHSYLKQKAPPEEVARVIEDLMLYQL